MRFMATAAIIIVFNCSSFAAPPKLQQIHGEGCVEPGADARCLVVKDVRSGAQFDLFVKGVQPAIGSGIEFLGVPHHGVTICTQGIPVDVERWVHRDLKCTQATAPRPKK
ncbi:MAG TPA: hypothetical protein VGF82_22310 [Terracidiphilus sp.]|jgi:hypothetical protein